MIEIQEYAYIPMEEAKKYKYNLKTKMELKHLAKKLNAGKEIDWNDKTQTRWAIGYDYRLNKLFLFADNIPVIFQGIIYCLNNNFLKEAKEQIGEQRLIDMIRSGV